MKTLLATKLGVTQYFYPDGSTTQATVLKCGPCYISQIKTKQRDGYNAIQIAYDDIKKVTKPLEGHFKGANIPPKKYLTEFKVDDTDIEKFQLSEVLKVDIFKPGDFVDVTGFSKGKGFAGVVKRWGFSGGPKTHGQSDKYRSPGSLTSARTGHGVKKGQKMAGRLGNRKITLQHLHVLNVDPQKNLLVLKGSVPGNINSLLTVKETVKKVKFKEIIIKKPKPAPTKKVAKTVVKK